MPKASVKRIINKKKELQDQATKLFIQIGIMILCFVHLFLFTTDIFGENMIPKLLCSFLIVHNWPLYIGINISIYYIKKIPYTNKLYTKYIMNIINKIKPALFRTIPIFDRYILFMTDGAKKGQILSQFIPVQTNCPL